MQTFTYTGYRETSGDKAKGLIDADTEKQAREHLRAQGIYPDSVCHAENISNSLWQKKRRMSSALKAVVYLELSELITGGLSLPESLDMVRSHRSHSAQMRAVWSAVHSKVNSGIPFSKATEDHLHLDAVESAALRIGEASGDLSGSLRELADYYEQQAHIKERATSALVYPVFIVVLAIVAALAIFKYVMPSMMNVFQDADMTIPWITRIMLAVSMWVNKFGWIILTGLGLLSVLGVYKYRRSVELRTRLHQCYMHIPVLGSLAVMGVSMTFSRSLVLLLRAGMHLTDAVSLAGSGIRLLPVRHQLQEKETRLKEGESLAHVMNAVPVFADSLGGWIEAGEKSGRLTELLESASKQLSREWQRSVQRALGLLEPLVIIIAGIVVFLVALAVILPIININQSIMP